MHYTYRKATIEDISLIRQLAYQAFAHTYASILTHDQIEYMLPMMYGQEKLAHDIHGQQPFYIAYHNGEPCGYFSTERENEHLFILQKIYLLPSFQSKGLGRRMIESAINLTINEHPHAQLQLFVNKANPALGFYRRMGFDVIDERTTDIGCGYVMDDYIMQLNHPQLLQFTNRKDKREEIK